jgi:aspartate/methionine/tyrosine aminotransferase
MSTQDLCEHLFEQHNLLLVPGECFGVDNHVRIGFGGPTKILQTGLNKLEQVLES